MPKKFTLRQRIHATFILGIAFFLVLSSNRLNNRNFNTVEHSINSVFDDRVMAQEYIYTLNNIFHDQEMLMAKSLWTARDTEAHTNIATAISNFEATELTRKESIYFDNLKKNYGELKTLEDAYAQEADPKTLRMIKVQLQRISENLDDLSKVQISEGRQLTQLSNKSLSMNNLLSKLEIAFLIIIGILLLLTVFHRDKSPDALGE
ncbi:hypothetical protein [Maribacter sp. 2307ULW6-5]|uniref:hypothetical protein n=1 Tax=Maribacter sp. 2307ULW6-5 TaxID=3386275 RepID=UPI0039BC3DF5